MALIKIENRIIDNKHKPFVIAEIGINHEGNFKKAIKMVDDAYKSGAECVKFQCHIIEDEMIKNDVIPGNAKEPIWNIIKRCSLTIEEDIKLKKYVESLGLIYLSTPFSRAAADRLEKMGVSAYKIGSGECNNYPLIEHIASFGKPIILSTGMNDIDSISLAVRIFEKCKTSYALLHCTSMYPTPYEKVRLNALLELKNNFPNAVIGLSDHSIGNYTSFAAIPLGACIIEKHFTSNKRWSGPDVAISLNPAELKDLIKGTEAIYKALKGKKEILKEEKPTINFAYSCVVSIKDIKKGEIFTKDNIWVKRPGTGEIKAKYFYDVIGKKAAVSIQKNKQIEWKMIEND